MIYLRYFKSLMLHKFYVFQAGIKVCVPVWRLLIHDWSKFLPAEFLPYAQSFFSDLDVQNDFDRAWLHHQNINPHHWQYWLLVYDDEVEKIKALPMPEVYIREMIADWMGASRAYTGSWNMEEWLRNNENNLILHNDTKSKIRNILEYELGYAFSDNGTWEPAAL